MKVVVAIIFFFFINLALSSNIFASNDSTSVGAETVTAKLYTCPTTRVGEVYETGRFRCSMVKNAGSCHYGDTVVGLFSDPERGDYFCYWRCRKIYPSCEWQ